MAIRSGLNEYRDRNWVRRFFQLASRSFQMVRDESTDERKQNGRYLPVTTTFPERSIRVSGGGSMNLGGDISDRCPERDEDDELDCDVRSVLSVLLIHPSLVHRVPGPACQFSNRFSFRDRLFSVATGKNIHQALDQFCQFAVLLVTCTEAPRRPRRCAG
jgi:hypothetical protein